MSGSDLARPRFRTTRWREGYAVQDVDNFLDEVFAAIAAGRPVPNIVEARFTTRRSRGYDMAEVDNFLDEVAAALKS